MKIAFHTLGCKVNQYETEAMAALFRQQGHVIVGETEFADVYVINTCTVTAVADRKSRQYIRRMKKINPDSVIAVTGCYAQIMPDEVASIEGVDIVTGTNEKGTIPAYVEEFLQRRREKEARGIAEADAVQRRIHPYEELGTYEDTGIVTSAENRTRAYIKVQDGCNRFCSYCVIPYARGPVRSRPPEEIREEAVRLIASGYRELVLTGINTALYGADKGMDLGIEHVIASLDALPGEFRIRLSSLEPTVVNADQVRRLFAYDRLCHHLHLSAQSGSDRVLAAMARRYDVREYLQIVDAVRGFDPQYGLSTDIIAGFPSETEADLADSISLIERACFCKTHVFRYSPRPKTSAAQMEDQIDPAVKAQRSDALQTAGAKAAERFFMENKGKVRTVLFEEFLEDGWMTGYTDNYIRVYVPCGKEKAEHLLNEFAEIRLTDIYRDGMRGETGI